MKPLKWFLGFIACYSPRFKPWAIVEQDKFNKRGLTIFFLGCYSNNTSKTTQIAYLCRLEN